MAFYDGDRSELPLVRFEPCAQFRIPLEGDLLTCRDCGYWIAEHDTDPVDD